MSRQLSQREMKPKKEEIVSVTNVSKQGVSIQLMPPINPKTGKRLDFFIAEQTVAIPRGKTAKLPKSRLYMDQINNLQKSKMITVKKGG